MVWRVQHARDHSDRDLRMMAGVSRDCLMPMLHHRQTKDVGLLVTGCAVQSCVVLGEEAVHTMGLFASASLNRLSGKREGSRAGQPVGMCT